MSKRPGLIRFALNVLLLFFGLTVGPVIAFKWIDPPTSSVMMQNYFAARAAGQKKSSIKYQWTDFADISPFMPLAVIASEDQKFPYHSGFDLGAIELAFQHNLAGKPVRGASTISQQVAKNLFLWLERSWLRKGLEAYFTFLIEMFWSKQRILEVYMNIAGLGGNVFGVGAASQYFFHKPARLLNADEAALLAAVLPSPSRFKVSRPSPYLLQRQRWILRHMTLLGGIKTLNKVTHD